METNNLLRKDELFTPTGSYALTLDGFWLVDSKGKLLEVNDNYCRMSGYSEQELLSMYISDLEAVEAEDETSAHIHRIMDHGSDFFESRHRRKDGSFLEVEISVRHQTPEGDILIVLIHDITKRKRAEEKLSESEKRYRTLFEDNNDAIFLLDLESGFYIDCNRLAEKLSGYTRDEILTLRAGAFLPPKRKKEAVSNIELIVSQNLLRKETEIITKEGKIIPIEFNSSKIEINNKQFILSMLHDISDRKAAEEALRQSEEELREKEKLFRESQAAAQIGSYSSDLIQKTWKATPAIYEIFGIDKSHPHTLDAWARCIHPDFRKELIDDLFQKEHTDSKFEHEYKIIRVSDGEERWVYGHGKFEYDDQMNPVRLFGTIQDITKRKQAEIALIQLNEELETRVRERTEELLQSNNALKQLQKDILNAIIQTEEKERAYFSKELHDGLGPLLSTIRLYLQWSERPKIHKSWKEIISKAEDLLEDALTTVKEISNKLSPHLLTNYGLTVALQRFIEKIRETCDIKINFESNIDRRFDMEIESTLYRGIIECINNTIKHAGAKTVSVSIVDTGEEIYVQYLDDGNGFDLEETLSLKKGLGLFNLQTRIENIGGKIEMNSKPEYGVNYQIIVPVLKPPLL